MTKKYIPFNKPYLTGKETYYIEEAVSSGKISGNGLYTKKCQSFFETNFNIKKALLTTSCTDALEMSAILLNINEGDEVIMPSFTFVSTANAFVLRGAKIVFADSKVSDPNIDVNFIEKLITPKTKAIVVVHYAGIAVDMDMVMQLAKKYNLFVVEDAAQAICSKYKGNYLGSIGHLATFSFHETKNIISGEGGLLAINDDRFIDRSEIIWEKGTNRSAFFRGEIDKYGWVDLGSSFLPSEITAAFLWAQIETIDSIQEQRLTIWNYYNNHLKNWANECNIQLMPTPNIETNNGHMYYLVCESKEQRKALINHLKQDGIHAVFHYISLHSSSYYIDKHDGRNLKNSDKFTNKLLRLPMFFELNPEIVVNSIINFKN